MAALRSNNLVTSTGAQALSLETLQSSKYASTWWGGGGGLFSDVVNLTFYWTVLQDCLFALLGGFRDLSLSPGLCISEE